MNPSEIEELLARWHNAVTKLWSRDVIETARGAMIECPCYSQEFGKVTVSLSQRGLDVSVGSEPTDIKQLFYTTVFRLSDFKAVREFVTNSIQKGRAEVASQVKARKAMMDSGFDDFKKEVAEWNLQCDKGQDV